MPRYYFSKSSAQKITLLDIRLQGVLLLAINHTDIDFKVVDTYRTLSEHQILRKQNKTRVDYNSSKHSKRPALAFDLAAMPNNKVNYSHSYYYYINGIIDVCVAEINRTMKNIRPFTTRWGGHWRYLEPDFNDPKKDFMDLCHWELVELSSKEGEI